MKDSKPDGGSPMAIFTASYTGRFPRLLVGWAEIETYCRKSRRTLRRYRRLMGLPVFRWGRHAVSSPQMIDHWLLAVYAVRQRQLGPKGKRIGGYRYNSKSLKPVDEA